MKPDVVHVSTDGKGGRTEAWSVEAHKNYKKAEEQMGKCVGLINKALTENSGEAYAKLKEFINKNS